MLMSLAVLLVYLRDLMHQINFCMRLQQSTKLLQTREEYLNIVLVISSARNKD